ncbi:MAG: hypothetical protein M1812_001909 [Candelaria pacifica]|nr:MAG: hypothetical protein M1812_001909 [Candelaria pacifica]
MQFPKAMDQIRADFTVCSLPGNSLNGDCVMGAQNEPANCGYSDNLIGLCSYCASSSPNATDSCCVNSKVESRCDNVHLPSTTSLPPLFPSPTSTSAPSSTNNSSNSDGSRLSGGQIAGIVVGSVVGAALLLALLICCCVRRRKAGSKKGSSIFNQPSPQRQGGNSMTYNPIGSQGPPQQGYEVLPGGRIARMSALEGPSSDSPPHESSSGGGVTGGNRRRNQDTSSSSGYGDSPTFQAPSARDIMAPPPLGRRTGSLSSGSMLAGDDPMSPHSGSGGQFSSPEGVASGQSEQLDVFKDYYSQEEIHPNEKVATLWAYEPRANDEFRLERGDMLKVEGIWDDGWATGIRLDERAEDWDARRKLHRDSGVSNGSTRRTSSPPPPGEIKAFPVCDTNLLPII